MRMIHYFTVLAAVVVPALLATAWLGITGDRELHLTVGFVTAIATVGLHSLVILFMLITGRILREAVKSRDLPREFLDELNRFFAERVAYPAALFAAFFTVAAGVLGYGAPAFGLSPAVHMLAGLLALVFNLWAITVEVRALRGTRVLIDRAASALDEIDRELAARGELPEEERALSPRALAHGALLIAFSAWLPYFYWVIVEWRGDFSKTSVHPWLEVSVLSLGVWFLARRESGSHAQGAE